MTSKNNLIILGVAAAALGMTVAKGQVVLTVGTIDVPAESAAYSIDLFVNNTSGAPVAVASLDFGIATAEAGPKIGTVDLLTGTVFASDNNGVFAYVEGDHGKGYALTEAPPSGPNPLGNIFLPTGLTKIATVSFNTVGISPGVYTLSLTGSGGSLPDTDYSIPSSFDPLGMSVFNGSLNVTAAPVPEPEEMALGSVVALVAWGALRRFRR